MIPAIFPVAAGMAAAPRTAKASADADAVFGALVAKAAGASGATDATAIVPAAALPAKVGTIAIDRPLPLPQAVLDDLVRAPTREAQVPAATTAGDVPAAVAETVPVADPIATMAALPEVPLPAAHSIATPPAAPTTLAALMATSMLRPPAGVPTPTPGAATPSAAVARPATSPGEPDPILPSGITNPDPAADPGDRGVSPQELPLSREVGKSVAATATVTSPPAVPAELSQAALPNRPIAPREAPIAGEPRPAPIKAAAVASTPIVTAAIEMSASSAPPRPVAPDPAGDEPATPAPPKPRQDTAEPATGLQAVIAAMAASGQPAAVATPPAAPDPAAKRIAPEGSGDRQAIGALVAAPAGRAGTPPATSEAPAPRRPPFVIPTAPAQPGEETPGRIDAHAIPAGSPVASPVVNGGTNVVGDVAVLPGDVAAISQPSTGPIEQPAPGAAPVPAPPASQAVAASQPFAAAAAPPSKPATMHGEKRASSGDDALVAVGAATGTIGNVPDLRQVAAPATPDLTTPAAMTGPTAAMSAAPLAEAALSHHLNLAKDSAWLDRLAHDIARSADSGGQLRFSLAPEHLGRLEVALAQSADGTAIRLTTETREAHRIVAEAQPRLVAEARAQGLRVTDATVDLGSSSHPRQDAAPQQGFGNQNGAGGGQPQRSFLRPQPSAPAPVTAAVAGTGDDDALYA